MRIDEVIQQPGQKERLQKRDIFKDLHVAIPGEIVSYDADRRMATVQPTIRDWGSRENPPLITDVPVYMWGNFIFTPSPGDRCLVICADSCVDAWVQNGGVNSAAVERSHSLSDGFAFVGFNQTGGTDISGIGEVVSKEHNGLCPQLPDETTTTKFLRQDGTWQEPEGSEPYSLPLAADGTRGGVQVGYVQDGRNYPVELSDEKMYVNVPWEDTHTPLYNGLDQTSEGYALDARQGKALYDTVITKLTKTGDTMTGNLTMGNGTNIAYAGTGGTINMIKFMNGDANGHGVVIGGGGLTIIGGGESASNIASGKSGNTETMYIGSDGAVYIMTNCQSGVSSAKTFTFGSTGNLTVPGTITASAGTFTVTKHANASATPTGRWFGKVAVIVFNGSTSTTGSGWKEIGTAASGYRPQETTYFAVMTASDTYLSGKIETSGLMSIHNAAAGTSYHFSVTYIFA